ncbi:FAD-dependent monooxygenase [Microbacterium sp. KR10-403]|uniref:FAD-dependent monooxygenase n=1 Tax=Microbacterium sp. KR10-403 TaxID=3158581 RepID=UPI0032E39F21
MTGIRVLIIGGGPAGLVTGIALARIGARVRIVERESAQTPTGVAVNIQNSPLRALAALGLIDEIVAAGHTTATVHLLDADGAPTAPPLRPRTLVPGYPASIELHRSDLARILERTALDSGVDLRYAVSVSALHDESDDDAHRARTARVDVTFTDGTADAFDLVVAADGIRSSTREVVFGQDAAVPVYSGQCIWRAEAERGDIDELMMLSGPEGKLGLLPLSDDTLYVYLLKSFAAEPSRGDIGDVDAALRAGVSAFGGPATGIAATLRPGADFRGLYSVLQPAPWHRGRVVLVGDAAHATTPHLAYGFGLAVEDALVLAESLQVENDVPAALRSFTARRIPRCRLVVENSRQLSDWEQHAPADASAYGRLMADSMSALTELP